jgi:hypothetical protein
MTTGQYAYGYMLPVVVIPADHALVVQELVVCLSGHDAISEEFLA